MFRKSRRTKSGYRSKFEGTIAAQLQTCGVKWSYESEQLKYSSKVRGGNCPSCGSTNVEKHRTYTPDFIVITKKGKKVYLETKGRLTSQDRTKMIDVLKAHPKITLVMVFMQDGKIGKKRYSDWCKKNNINYCIKEVDFKWLI